jgi:hypothetical protein
VCYEVYWSRYGLLYDSMHGFEACPYSAYDEADCRAGPEEQKRFTDMTLVPKPSVVEDSSE